MARAPIGRHSCGTDIRDSANDNDFPIRHPNNDARQTLPEELIEAGFVTDEDLVIVRDPVSDDWLVEDYAGEAVLFHMPRDCSSDEVRRAAALYAAAFKSGFEQGRFVARSTSSLGGRISVDEPSSSPIGLRAFHSQRIAYFVRNGSHEEYWIKIEFLQFIQFSLTFLSPARRS